MFISNQFSLFRTLDWKTVDTGDEHFRIRIVFNTTVLFDFTGQSVYKCTFVYVTSSIVFCIRMCTRQRLIDVPGALRKDVCTFYRTVSSMGTLCIHYTKSGLYCTFCTRHPCWDSFVEWTHQVYEHLYKQYVFHD